MKKNVWIHVGIVLAMLAVSMVYFSPVLGGKMVKQGDTIKFESMVRETKAYHEATGEYALWNSAMFGGMPVYQIGGNAPMQSVFAPLRGVVNLEIVDWGRSVGVLFLYLIGFYVALLLLGCNPWVSLVGALAFGLGSYNIIIVEAGHISKAWAMAMMAPVLAGMVLCLRKPKEGKDKWKDWLWGGTLFTLALGLQLNFNHIQITYYTVIGAVVLGLTYAVVSIRQKYVKKFLIGVGLLVGGSALAFACNARGLVASMEYAEATMRGGNELTVTPEEMYGQPTGAKSENTDKGLNIEYAMKGWSYGKGETLTLLVPGAWGGATYEGINPEKSEFAKMFTENGYGYPWGEKAPLYRGDMRYTSGPVYFGAVVMLLFLLGMVVVKGADRWWVLVASVVAVVLAWGYHWLGLNGWLFENLPYYNKFRTPSMALVLANVCMALMAGLTLKHVFDPKNTDADRKRIMKGIYIAGGSLVLLLLGMIVASGSFDYSGVIDGDLKAKAGLPDEFIGALKKDRQSLLVGDAWRSLLFIVLAGVTLWLYTKGILKKAGVALAIVGALVVVDLWTVDRRYLNESNFVSKDDPESVPTEQQYDYDIDAYAAQYGDKDYRVFTLAGGDPFNDSHPAAFHHQIGGYSAVKMSRYQNLIEFYISPYANMIYNVDQGVKRYLDSVSRVERITQEQQKQIIEREMQRFLQGANVANMLNTRYVVDYFGLTIRNPHALGNCWLVKDVWGVDDVNKEIVALKDFNPAEEAVVNTKEFPEMAKFSSAAAAGDTIWMEHQDPYNPNLLKYHSRTKGDRLAVFSEIYYAPDWRVYIDGQEAEYFRVNYVLRGVVIPAGEHEIVFKDEAPTYHKMNLVTILGSVVLVLVIGGGIFLVYRKRPHPQTPSPRKRGGE